MDIELMLAELKDKDTSKAFKNLQELELLSDSSDILYPYISVFIEMTASEKYVIRVRGFRLLCKQAKWDSKNIINKNLKEILSILEDEKPTAVRQALNALKDIVIHKKELHSVIKKRVLSINYLKYKDTMHGLICKDIQNLLQFTD